MAEAGSLDIALRRGLRSGLRPGECGLGLMAGAVGIPLRTCGIEQSTNRRVEGHGDEEDTAHGGDQ